jgi:peptidoglycan/LPS O-acetylase OafA/YrhL
MNRADIHRLVAQISTQGVSQALRLAGQVLLLLAIAVLLTAWHTTSEKGWPNLALLVGAAGVAMAIAGALMIFRRRRDLVEKLLAGLTAASFAIALAVASAAGPTASAETVFQTFQPALFFAVWLFLALALRDGYRRVPLDSHDG